MSRTRSCSTGLILVTVASIIAGCESSPRAAQEASAPIALPQVRIEPDPDAHSTAAIGLHLVGFKITAPPGHSLTTIYRFYRHGELDEANSVVFRTFGRNGATDRISLGTLDPNGTRPEPSSKVKVIGPPYTHTYSWFEVGKIETLSLASEHGETGLIGRETPIAWLTVNEPIREPGDPTTDDLRLRAPIYVTASYRVDPLTEDQRRRLDEATDISESVSIDEFPPPAR